MKKIIVAVLLVVGITAFAQEKKGRTAGREKLTSEQKVDFQVKKMTTDLNLNEKQVKDVRALVAKQVDKREAKKAEMKNLQTKKSEERRAQMKVEQAVVSAEMKEILTAEQFAKWEKNREEKKEKMKEKMSERREKSKSHELPESK